MSADDGRPASPGVDLRGLTIGAEAPIVARDYGGQGGDAVLLHGRGRSMEDWRLGTEEVLRGAGDVPWTVVEMVTARMYAPTALRYSRRSCERSTEAPL